MKCLFRFLTLICSGVRKDVFASIIADDDSSSCLNQSMEKQLENYKIIMNIKYIQIHLVHVLLLLTLVEKKRDARP